MKKIKSLIVALTISALATFPAFAGQWEQDQNGFRYKNDDGTYKTGWHQDADGKWYYLDNTTNYMLTNTITPDGYFVNENGVWIEGGEARAMENVEKTYDNKAELYITAYSGGPGSGGPGGAGKIDSPIFATVYYDNEYTGEDEQTIKVVQVGAAKDGVANIQCVVNQKDVYGLKMKIDYTLEDNSHVELTDEIEMYCSDVTDVHSFGLSYPYDVIRKGSPKPVSAVIYIYEGGTVQY